MEAGGGLRAAVRLIGQHDVAGRVARRLARGVHEVLEHVRKGPVAEVVEQPRHLGAGHVGGVQAVRVRRPQPLRRAPGQVRDAYGVLAPRVRGRRVDEGAAAELADAVEAKKKRVGGVRRCRLREVHVAVHAVVDAPRVHSPRVCVCPHSY